MYEIIDVELDSRYMPIKVTLLDLATKEEKTVIFAQLLMYGGKYDVRQLNECVKIRKIDMCIEQDLSTRDIAFTQGNFEEKLDLQSFLPYTASQFKDDSSLDTNELLDYIWRNYFGTKYLAVKQRFYDDYDDSYFIGICKNNAQNAVAMLKEYLKMQLTMVDSPDYLEKEPLTATVNTLVEILNAPDKTSNFAILNVLYENSNFAIKIGDKALVRQRCSIGYRYNYDLFFVDVEHFKEIDYVPENYQLLLGISKASEDYGLLIEEEEICSLVKTIAKEAGYL